MNIVRALFILAIVTAAVLSSECVFIIATIHESSNFQEAYEQASTLIIDNFYHRMNTALWNAKGISTAIALSYFPANWPNVTIANFPSLCESALVLSQATSIAFQPLVSSVDRDSWETYAATWFPLTQQTGRGNQSSDETIDFFDTDRLMKESIFERAFEKKHSAMNVIYTFQNRTSFDAPTDSALLFPNWQMYPLPKSAGNSQLVVSLFDEHSNPVRATALQGMLSRNGSTISSFLFQDTNQSDLAYHHVPRSNIYYPIFDRSNDANAITGSINLQIMWDAMLSGAVLDRKEPMIVVVESSCGGIFSYKVKGSRAYYYGPGELQNKTVNGQFTASPSSYDTFLLLFNEHGMTPMGTNSSCSYKISVYASQAFKDVVSLQTSTHIVSYFNRNICWILIQLFCRQTSTLRVDQIFTGRLCLCH
jgi:hypothetical protein